MMYFFSLCRYCRAGKNKESGSVPMINSCLVSPTHAKKFLHIRNAGVEDKSVIFSG